MIILDTCPVCGSAEIQPVFDVKDHTVSKELFPVFHCNHCTARFTNNIPGEAEIGAYYKSEDYISHTETSKGFINSVYHSVRRRTLQQKKILVKNVTGKETGNLLDLGCGTGAFLQVMQEGKWRVKGLEPDPDARAIAAARGLDVSATTQFFHLPPASFDVVTLWHVLEHVHQLHPYMEQLKTILKPDGLIVIAVPNYTSGDAQRYGKTWAAYDVPRHLYHFSPQSMKTLVQQHGLTVQDIRPMWFDSFYVSMLSEKYREAGSLGLLKAFWNGVSSNLGAARDTTKCSSLIYLIRKTT